MYLNGFRKYKMKGIPVSQQATRYAIEHINDRPRTAVAKEAGISISFMYSLVRKHGGEQLHHLAKKRENIEEQIARLYPNHTHREIADMLGIGRTTVQRWKDKLGLHHSEEYEEQMIRKRNMKLREGRKRIDYTKSAEKRSKARRRDELRAMSGLPQKTKFHISFVPNRIYAKMWYLANKYDYFYIKDDSGLRSTTMYYDDKTHRCKNEQHFIDKFGIRFEPANGLQRN